MGLENLKSVFNDDFEKRKEAFINRNVKDIDSTSPIVGLHSSTPPLSELNITSLKDSNGWESLFNSNHTPNDGNPNSIFKPYSYGGNVSRGNLNIKGPVDGRFGFGGSTRTSAISAIGKLIGQIPFLEGDTQQFLQDAGKEPYIVSRIPKTDGIKGGRLINMGSRDFPFLHNLTDTMRLAKFLTSPAGVLFIAKQNFLGNPDSLGTALGLKTGLGKNQKYKSIYNPISTLASSFLRIGGGTIVNLDKTQPDLGLSILTPNQYPDFNPLDDVIARNSDITASPDVFSSTGKGSPIAHRIASNTDANKVDTKKINDVAVKGNNLSTLRDGVQFKKPKYGPFSENDESYKGEFTLGDSFQAFVDNPNDSSTPFVGDKMTLAPMIKGENLTSTTEGTTTDTEEKMSADLTSEKEGMPFYFKDLRDGAYIFFRAYLEGLTENITPNYNPTQYIGRSEPVYTYGNTERDISFTLKLAAQTKDELPAIYKKLNRLTSMCYPEYYTDNGVNYGNRMKPPLTKLRMGELFGTANNELMGYIKSVNYNVEGNATYETAPGKRVPKFVNVSLSYQVIHGVVPQFKASDGSDYKFYGYVGD